MNGLLVLAAGKGSRMKSAEPKVLVPFLGEPMLGYMLKGISRLFPRPFIVVGYRGDEVRERLGEHYHYIQQKKPLGTGNAVLSAKEEICRKKDLKNIVIIPGDHPLISHRSLEAVIRTHEEENAILTLATTRVPAFTGHYRNFMDHGRIIRDEAGKIKEIKEYKDCSAEERKIKEVNVSYYCLKSEWLWANIGKIKNANASKEYYLTDLIALTVRKTPRVAIHVLENPFEGMGANTMKELKEIEEIARTQSASLDL